MDNDIVIIGAGPAGLATAASLTQRGMQARVIDAAADVGASWRAHYDRLRLHTLRTWSALPGLRFPPGTPRYPSRRQMVDYLDAYARRFGIRPEFGQQVLRIDAAGSTWTAGWTAATTSGRTYSARHLVVATGANRCPRLPAVEGQALFSGNIMHSQAYRNAAPFSGRRVLVVGIGNTGAEIALDLAQQGVRVALSARSPQNIVYRDVLGVPVHLTALLLSRLPASWGDKVSAVLRDLTVGDLRRWGIRTSPLAPMRQVRESGRAPLIDTGTVACIRRGEIRVHPGIARFLPHGVAFADGSEAAFDAVIFATGYQPQLAQLFPGQPLQLDRDGLPLQDIGTGMHAGLYFVGFDTHSPEGMLRRIALQARQVASAIHAQAEGRVPVTAGASR
jgi:cation diffusion facilitator CzcD-associated flavoprotein CzcO